MPTRILLDSFFHMRPGHRVGPHIVVGGYHTNFGRYSLGDVYHPNGLAHLEAMLAGDYEFRMLTEPYTATSLYDADILLVINPDYPLYEGASPHRWTPDDVDALLAFMRGGGSVILAVNSFLSRPDFWEENFDIERVSLLFERLGLRWDPNYMSGPKTERAQAGRRVIGYGQGGRVVGGKLPRGFNPLITYNGMTYGFTGKIGRGTLAVVGDAGLMSNGLLCFPGYENAAFLKELFTSMRPKWTNASNPAWSLRRYGHLSGAPSAEGVTEPFLRSLRPNGVWMVDHHYRQLTWEQEERPRMGAAVWKSLPVDVDTLRRGGKATVPLNWLHLDSDEPGGALQIDVISRVKQGSHGAEIRALGRAQTETPPTRDFLKDAKNAAPLGTVEALHTVIELDALLDSNGRPQRARWRQGQMVFARNPKSRYGFNVLLSSTSGVIAPTHSGAKQRGGVNRQNNGIGRRFRAHLRDRIPLSG